jgi:hypothetical protein
LLDINQKSLQLNIFLAAKELVEGLISTGALLDSYTQKH